MNEFLLSCFNSYASIVGIQEFYEELIIKCNIKFEVNSTLPSLVCDKG